MINEELLQIIIRKHLPPSFMGYGQNGFMCQVHYPELLKIIKDYEAQQQVKVEPEVSVKTAGTKEIDVWRIEAKGVGSAYYEHDLSIVEDMLKSCDYEEGYIITKHKMDKAKYEALPEFTGF